MFKPNILIPMAGAGKRFAEAGYALPKPLIDINGKPMIQRVVESLNIDGNYIFLVQKEHFEHYHIYDTLEKFCINSIIVTVDGITEGAACTALLAKKYINYNTPLIIANSDQLVYWNSSQFLAYANNYDGCIPTFYSQDPKWSYAKLYNGFICEVAEKKPISEHATVGIYFFKQGKWFVKAAEQMIESNTRTNNEFYICPVYNEMVANNMKMTIYPVRKMVGLGTPEDLEKNKCMCL